MAKDILGRHVRLYFDDSGTTPRELSGDLLPNTLSGVGMTPEEIDMTGQSDAVMTARTGISDSTITGQFYMNNTATTGAYTVLEPMQGLAGTLTIEFGTNAAPTTDDPDWEGEYVLMDMTVGLTDGKAVMNVTWRPDPDSAAAVWGTKT